MDSASTSGLAAVNTQVTGAAGLESGTANNNTTVKMFRKGFGNKVCSRVGVFKNGLPKMTVMKDSGKVMYEKDMVDRCKKTAVLKKAYLFAINQKIDRLILQWIKISNTFAGNDLGQDLIDKDLINNY